MTGPRIGSLCTGYGGLDMAAQEVFGGEVAWVSDIDPGACKLLAHHYPGAPNLGDLKTIDWAAVEPVDMVCAGYPCQPFSDAGPRKGTEDERHLWPWIVNSLRVLRPRVAIFENVSGHLRRGFDTVLADLADLGFDAEWITLRASDVGAPHPRNRLFILAVAQDADGAACGQWRFAAPGQAESGRSRADLGGRGGAPAAEDRWGPYAAAITRWEDTLGRSAPRPTEPGRTGERLSRFFIEWLMGLPAGHVTEVPDLSPRQQVHALGNGVVPQQAAYALRLLANRASSGVAA